jgi:phage shock protein PspC (stress-responsive transcriptional regulator)
MSSPKRLYRNSAAGRIAGVCAGIAEYLEADVTLIRLVWIVLSIVPGGFIGGIVAYVAAWAIMPDSSIPAPAETATARLKRSTIDRKVAGVCGGLAEYFSVDSTAVRVLWVILTIIPGAIVLGVLAYIVAWFIMPADPPPHVVVSPAI